MADNWEYKVVVLPDQTLEKSLNDLGNDGWELIGFDRTHGRWVLKRKKATKGGK